MTGNGYIGSNKLETSIANKELLPNKPERWTTGYKVYKLAFMNNEACTIIINDNIELYLQKGQGFQIERGDLPLHSFRVKESNIPFNWTGAY